MDNDSTITVELCWRIRMSRLGDTLQKLRLVTWEKKVSKFEQWRRKWLYFVTEEFFKVSFTVLHCNVQLSKKSNVVLKYVDCLRLFDLVQEGCFLKRGSLFFLIGLFIEIVLSLMTSFRYSWCCVLPTCKRVTVDVATASSMQSLLSRVTSPGKSLRKGLRFLRITSAKLFACFLSAFCALSRISWFGRSTDSSFSSRYLPSNWCKILVVSVPESSQRLRTKQRKLY